MADPEAKPSEVAEEAGSVEEATSEEPSSQTEDSGQPTVLASQLMRNPAVLAALQDKLGSMVGHNSGYIQSLPKSVKRRIKALKKIQFEATKIEAEFYREVHRLECEYAAKYSPLFEKRNTIVVGQYEPNDEEADWPSDEEREDELAKDTAELASGDTEDDVEKKATLEEKEENAEKEEEKDETKGIPGFWLTIFKNVDLLSDMVQPNDEPILNHLQDIKVEFKEKDPMGFTLEFYFEPNEHFENKKLTKEYVMRSEPEDGDPFSFEGPEIIKCHGCKIDWKKGKNITVKTVKKKQKHKASGTTRTIQKTVQNDSFFNFFTPPTPPEDEEMDEGTEAVLAADFEIGHFIRERIVPRAVLYFTGEALENEDDYEDGDEEEGAEEGEYDEEADPDYNPGRRTKFVTREFQDRCAKLALGRESKPSSAPCDTRLFMRPISASADRRTVPAQMDTRSRPQTAPTGSQPSLAGSIKSEPEKPPELTDELFRASMHDLSKTLPVVSKRAEMNLQKTLLRESTEIFLPNAMDSQGVEVRGSKSTSSKPAKQPPPPGYPRTPYMKPPPRMSRERTFLKVAKSPRDVIKARPIHKPSKSKSALDSVEEYSETDDDDGDVPAAPNAVAGPSGTTNASSKDVKGQKPREPVSKHTKATVHQPAGDEVPVGTESKIKTKDIRTVGVKQTEKRGGLKRNEEELGKTGQKPAGGRVDRNQTREVGNRENERSHWSGKAKSRAQEAGSEKPSTKDAAYTILQKLTGKHQPGSHQPGQVPSVNRKPVRKYKFDTPSEPLASQGGEQPHKDTYQQDLGKTIGIKPGDARRTGSIRRVDRAQKEHSERKIQDVSDVYDQRSQKPVSAPVRGSLRQSKDFQGKEWNRSTKPDVQDPKHQSKSADVRGRDKQKVTNAGKTADVRQSIKIVVSDDGVKGSVQEEHVKAQQKSKPDGKSVSSAGSHGNRRQDHRTNPQKTGPTKSGDVPSVTKSDKTAGHSASGHSATSKGRGVKLQNAMIAASQEVSDSKIQQDGDRDSLRSSSVASDVHPKLRDSPYLKDNPLLQSGKYRKRPGAGGADGPGRSKELS